MCHNCNTKPVYEFTNKRKLCRRCFINWFNKKVLYTIRKFEMIKRGDVVYTERKKEGDFRSAVLDEVLKMFKEKLMIEVVETRNRKVNKIAIPETTDSTSDKIVHELVKGKFKNLRHAAPVEKNIIKPLYLFTDKEVLLYAKLKRLKFIKVNEKKDKISNFIDVLEKKHPEVNRAVVNGILGLEN